MPNTPKISVIICTYNREKFLPGALNSLTKQTVKPNDFEIIIVNNNSTDNTELISKRFIDDNPQLHIKYFVETQKGLSAARNRGINEASAGLIIFIDDDAEVTDNYLQTAINFFDKFSNVDSMGGKIIPIYENGKEPEWLSEYLWGLVTKCDWGDKIRNYPYSKYPPGCSMAFRKNVFDEIGLFNTDLLLRSDDKYIFRQMEDANKKYLYNPDFIVYHHIDKERTEYNSVKKISLIVGTSERLRLKDSGLFKNILKILEYLFKLSAAIIIAIFFLFKLELAKARYIIINRWFTLLGYFKKTL